MFFWCNNNNGLQAHTILHAYIILHAHTKLATTPPPLHTRSTALAIKRAPCGHTPRGTDGDAAWPRQDFPPKRPRGPPQQMLILICLFPKRGAAGGGVACPPDWRTWMQRAQKRAGRVGGRRKQSRVLERRTRWKLVAEWSETVGYQILNQSVRQKRGGKRTSLSVCWREAHVGEKRALLRSARC